MGDDGETCRVRSPVCPHSVTIRLPLQPTTPSIRRKMAKISVGPVGPAWAARYAQARRTPSRLERANGLV